MESSEFFDKLWAVNWIEKKYEREHARRSGSGPLLDSIKAAVEDVVQSFNARYRNPREEVKITPGKDMISLSMKLPGAAHEHIKHATAILSFDDKACKVSATFKHSASAKEYIVVDVDDDGNLFLKRGGDNSTVKDADEASKLLLQTFLFELEKV
jgi:hypothetical protein